jgi:hypothetical protein
MKLELKLNVKTLLTVGGVAITIAAIAGGFKVHQSYKAAEEKKAAELAYANRPIVNEACIMDGYGKGNCDFTNTGKTAGAICGVIQVNGPGIANSNKFCSGMVAPMSTTKVEFNIPAVDQLCDNGFNDWRDKCDFSFVKEGVEA